MIKKYVVCLLGCLIILMGTSSVFCTEPPPLMHVDEIRPGMKGVGKTVFSGTTIEEFDAEILAVLKNQTPHGDAIMAKVTGGPLPLEKSGVLAGMSGSPIYIDGKLIGALAFIPSIFPKEPMIAGITPIHEMLRDAERVRSRPKASQNVFLPFENETPAAGRAFHLTPIQTLLTISGADPQVLSFMEEQLAPLNIMPVQGGSASQALLQEADTDLKPGSAVGVQLVRGDMDISTVGTVTYRDGDRIIAFGHPMFFAGDVQFPMTAAYVHLTVSNLMNSFKLASSLKPVGSILQDRRTGISGIIGQLPRMLPLEVSVRYAKNSGETQQYMFEVIDHAIFTSQFMKVASLDALLATERFLGEFTISTRTTIEFEEFPPLIIEDQFTGKSNPIPAILGAFAPLDTLINNILEPITVKKVSVGMTVKDSLQFAEIVGLRVQNNIVSPGEEIEATISLRPYGEKVITITEVLAIPEDVPQGSLQLLACDANVIAAFETIRAQAKFQPQTLAQLKKILQEKVSRSTIVLSLFQLRPGAIIQGQELPSPPASMIAMMSSTGRYVGKNSLTRGRIIARKDIPTHYNISGCTTLEVIVDGNIPDYDGYSAEHSDSKEGEVVQ